VSPTAVERACAHIEPAPATYARRRPDKTVLYGLVREHAETLFAEARDRSDSGYGYPVHVENEFRRYVECGILSHGFLRVHCAGCGRDELVAFSCKARAVCPSCVGRRMSETAARLVDEKLPHAPYRQWVFSFPRRIRVALAKDTQLLSEVLRACMRKVFAYQRKKARALGLSGAKTFAVCFVQRFGSLLQMNPHAHAVLPDGVLVRDEASALTLHELSAPTTEEVEAVALSVVKAVLRVLERAAERADDDDEPAMTAALAQAVASGSGASQAPAGERSGGRATRRAAMVQTALGMFCVHADTSVAADNRRGLERLLRYCARPALAQKRLSRTASGKVRYTLRKPYYTGQTEVVLEPVAFLRRLAAWIPPVRQNQVRYYGALASQSNDREALQHLVSPPVPGSAPEPVGRSAQARDEASDPEAHRSRRSYRRSWARLLRRVFAIEILICPHCHGERTIISAITQADTVAHILTHLGLPTDTSELAHARAPPQVDMFCADDFDMFRADDWPAPSDDRLA